MEYFKSDSGNTHKIESRQVMCEEETGRVVATFYNDYDLDDVLKQINHNTSLYNKYELLLNETLNLNNKIAVLKDQIKYLTTIYS